MTKVKALRGFLAKFFNYKSNKMTVSDVLLDVTEHGTAPSGGGDASGQKIHRVWLRESSGGHYSLHDEATDESFNPTDYDPNDIVILIDNYIVVAAVEIQEHRHRTHWEYVFYQQSKGGLVHRTIETDDRYEPGDCLLGDRVLLPVDGE